MGGKVYRHRGFGPPPDDHDASTTAGEQPKPVDRWLTLAMGVVGIMAFLEAKTPLVIILALGLMFALALHPVWNFWWIEKALSRRIGAVTGLVVLLGFYGLHLSPRETPATTPLAVFSAFVPLYEEYGQRLGSPGPVTSPDVVYEGFHERGLVLWMHTQNIPGVVFLLDSMKWEYQADVSDPRWNPYKYDKEQFRKHGLVPGAGLSVPWRGIGKLLLNNRPLFKEVGWLENLPDGQIDDCNFDNTRFKATRVQKFDHGWVVGSIFPVVNSSATYAYILFNDSRRDWIRRPVAMSAPLAVCKTFPHPEKA